MTETKESEKLCKTLSSHSGEYNYFYLWSWRRM